MPGATSRKRPPGNALRFKRQLLRWFRQHARRPAWRDTRDAYEVVVSEFMLQQTQASRVIAFYERFLEQFPTVHELARARPSRVREAWQGLGYYRRAYSRFCTPRAPRCTICPVRRSCRSGDRRRRT